MAGSAQESVEAFAAWLRQVKLRCGDLSVRRLVKLTGEDGPPVPRSTLQDALDGRRLPSLDNAVRIVRAMTEDEATVEECRTRWRTARSAVKGWELAEMPPPATARPAPQHPGTTAPPPPVIPAPATPTPVTPTPVAPPPGRQPGAVRWRSRTARVAGVCVAVLALAGVGIYAISAHGSGSGSGSGGGSGGGSSHTPAAGSAAYTPAYTHRNLSLRDYNDYFDLIAGTVVTREGAWSLSTNSGNDSQGAFELQPLTDAYLAGRTVPTAAQCAAGLARRPTQHVRFPAVPPGSSFCLRNRTTGDIAVVQVNDLDDGNWAADIFLSYYRHATGTAAPTGT